MYKTQTQSILVGFADTPTKAESRTNLFVMPKLTCWGAKRRA